jgi:hypothetical protein
MCCITAGNDIAKGRASSLTEAGLATRRSMMARRVGSASAWNTVSRPDWLGTRLSVCLNGPKVKGRLNYSDHRHMSVSGERTMPGAGDQMFAAGRGPPRARGRLFAGRGAGDRALVLPLPIRRQAAVAVFRFQAASANGRSRTRFLGWGGLYFPGESWQWQLRLRGLEGELGRRGRRTGGGDGRCRLS